MRWLWLIVAFVLSAAAVIALALFSRDLLPDRPDPISPIVLVPETTESTPTSIAGTVGG